MTDRRGFSLAELLVAIFLLTAAGGVIYDGLRRQQQLFRSIAVMIGARADVRDAVEVLASDLLSASPLDTLPLATDSAAEFSATLGMSVSCDSAPGYTVRLPPERLASGISLTSLLALPDSNDLVLIYNDDSTATAGAHRWDRHAISAVSTPPASTGCPSSTGFTAEADAAAPATVIALRGAADSGIRRGAPIRILRRGRYSLYRSSDSRWYLGQRRCDPTGPSSCRPIQPLSGPYAPYSKSGDGGLALGYYEVTGLPISAYDAVTTAARVDIVVRGRMQSIVRLGGSGAVELMDSAAASVSLRNRD